MTLDRDRNRKRLSCGEQNLLIHPIAANFDLRRTRGGNLWTYFAALSLILGEGELGSFVYNDGSEERWRLETAVIPFLDLTDREREVLTLIAQGMNNHDIPASLHISSKIVSNYISSIFNKLQVADQSQVIVKAREAGLGKDRDNG